jgi:hypothetical protein
MSPSADREAKPTDHGLRLWSRAENVAGAAGSPNVRLPGARHGSDTEPQSLGACCRSGMVSCARYTTVFHCIVLAVGFAQRATCGCVKSEVCAFGTCLQ